MELTHIIAFNATLLAAILSPGPAMLMSIRASLINGGFRRGFIDRAWPCHHGRHMDGAGAFGARWDLSRSFHGPT